MKDFLNPWVIAGTILTASVLIALSFLVSGWLTSAPPEAYQGGAVITVIPVPTATPTPRPTATEIPLISPTPDSVNGIQLGGYVQISGTGGDGLRLRREPSLNGEIVSADGTTANELALVGPPSDSTLIEPILTDGRWVMPGDENAVVIVTTIGIKYFWFIVLC